MKEMLMNSNPALSEILFEYCKFLEFNTISDTTRSFDYIFDIIDYFNISDKFLRTVQFNSNIENNGVYIRSDKKIILNIAKLEAAYKLNFLSKEQFIIDYFSLLLHEINHVLQCKYRENIDDGISHILNVSDFLKTNFKNNVRMYHDFFPDEIDSNIRSAKIIYEMFLSNASKINLINYLMISMLNNNFILKSQIDFLYWNILGIPYNGKDEHVNCIYYGLPKKDEIIEAIIESYQTHKLCIDIDRERRIRLCN